MRVGAGARRPGAVALVTEGSSLVRAVLQVAGQARRTGRSIREAIRSADDPALRTVLAEDSTACFGVVLAMAGLGLHMITGEVRWEAWASMLIGALLVFVAHQLAKESRGQIIGEAADPAPRRARHPAPSPPRYPRRCRRPNRTRSRPTPHHRHRDRSRAPHLIRCPRRAPARRAGPPRHRTDRHPPGTDMSLWTADSWTAAPTTTGT